MKYEVKEDGKNGNVEVFSDRIVRTIKKTFGKDDVQTIPVRGVTSVHHDRKTFGSDIVSVSTGLVIYVWKTSKAQSLVDELNAAIYGNQ